MIKVMNIVTRKPGISREEFYKYWKNVHGPLVAKAYPRLKEVHPEPLYRCAGAGV